MYVERSASVLLDKGSARITIELHREPDGKKVVHMYWEHKTDHGELTTFPADIEGNIGAYSRQLMTKATGYDPSMFKWDFVKPAIKAVQDAFGYVLEIKVR